MQTGYQTEGMVGLIYPYINLESQLLSHKNVLYIAIKSRLYHILNNSSLLRTHALPLSLAYNVLYLFIHKRHISFFYYTFDSR